MSFIKTKILSLGFLYNSSRILSESQKIVHIRNYAARKGTRERKRKNKVKVEIQKVGFIPHNQREKDKLLASRVSKKFDDEWKRVPTDNVYPMKYYKWINYPFVEAVQAHRETHHPSMYNQPDASLYVTIELNMQAEKKNKVLDNFSRIAAIPNKFDMGEERTIIAFSKDEEDIQKARNAGAQVAGGMELIKQIQNGLVSLTDFNFIVAHPSILPELVVLRGLMKKRFPNPKAGTLDVDLDVIVKKFLNGISYKATKDEHEKDFGKIDTIIGTLNMDAKHLEENFSALIRDVNEMKPKREGVFINRCILWSPPSQELLKIDHNLYLGNTEIDNVEEEDEGEVVAL